MKSETCTESVSHNEERMLNYKMSAVSFSYPDDTFFKFFPSLRYEKKRLISEYDRLFRAEEIWLYGTEHLAKNEFQRSNYLSDIMGFYQAFGLEPDRDRPDSLTSELEFMHYLIFKRLYAAKGKEGQDAKEKVSIVLSAQKKFFSDHLYPSAKKIIGAILSRGNAFFYKERAEELLEFLESEKRFLTERKI